MSVINTWTFNNDELFNLVKMGCKTATCWLYDGNPPSEQAGDIEQIVNSNGEKITVKITNICVRRFSDIDAAWARKEGEGDRSLQYWQKVHTEFFSRFCNTDIEPNTKLVCTEFVVLSPGNQFMN